MGLKIFELDYNQPFNLDDTLSCGQVFRWEKRSSGWFGVAWGKALHVRQNGRIIEYSGCNEMFLRDYFQLDLNLDRILDSVNKDEHIGAAISEKYGLRLVSQMPWECLITYSCAQNANIPFISRMLEKLSFAYGEPLPFDEDYMDNYSPGVYDNSENSAGILMDDSGGDVCHGADKRIDNSGRFFSYPSAKALSLSCAADVSGCSTGYRSSYICDTAGRVVENPGWADEISALDYEPARGKIMEFKGVGPKVADCILLFAFQKFESFPVDVWMRRIMSEFYDVGNPKATLSAYEYDRIRRFAKDYFGEYAGYAQEYLFANRG
jgi:N-glycosylase/DNA lyase